MWIATGPQDRARSFDISERPQHGPRFAPYADRDVMSLILVVARALPEGPQQAAADGSELDRWAQMLSGGLGSGTDVMTVDYAASITDATAAAERAILAGNLNVALIPVTRRRSCGRGLGRGRPGPRAVAGAVHGPLQAASGYRYRGRDYPDRREPVVHRGALRPPSARCIRPAAPRRCGRPRVQRRCGLVRQVRRCPPGRRPRPGTQIALRGSAIQGYSYKTLEPFDAGGRGSSDLDVVLFGDDAMSAWDAEAFFIPGINTMPLGDESPWIAPAIEPARSEAQKVARRPVNIQAMARWFMDIRSGLQGTPYVLLDA